MRVEGLDHEIGDGPVQAGVARAEALPSARFTGRVHHVHAWVAGAQAQDFASTIARHADDAHAFSARHVGTKDTVRTIGTVRVGARLPSCQRVRAACPEYPRSLWPPADHSSAVGWPGSAVAVARQSDGPAAAEPAGRYQPVPVERAPLVRRVGA